jgi:hypothetical protein
MADDRESGARLDALETGVGGYMSRSPKIQDALRKLKNPYASLQLEVNASDEEVSAHALWKRSENPYARDFYLGQRGAEPPVESPSPRPKEGTLTQADFEKRARAIFRPYIPAEENGTLRPHYREFIERNKSRSPQFRFKLIGHLRRYDLSDLGGLTGQFNREEEAFTKEKLLEIEAKAGLKPDEQS